MDLQIQALTGIVPPKNAPPVADFHRRGPGVDVQVGHPIPGSVAIHLLTMLVNELVVKISLDALKGRTGVLQPGARRFVLAKNAATDLLNVVVF